jgi:Apea-like HEPN
MSLASATMLKAPIRFFVHDGKWEIHAMSQSQQQRASLRIVRDVDQEEISCTAVRTFFKPAIAAKNIPFAIEWFAMDATYNEVRLTSAMTALENLLNSNLSKADQHYSRAFKKITREARQFVIECMGRLASGDSVPDPDVLSAKVNDLNRKPLIEKIYRLARRWSVPIEDMDEEKISDAISARNAIVHRGEYYGNHEEPNDSLTDLWDHAMLIRELVVRFILTSYGYVGPYCTFVGGFRDGNFPPR